MAQFKNETSFSHVCRYGTKFSASRGDFRDGIVVKDKPTSNASFASDIAEMISFHTIFIHPELNGFQGYDCINWIFKK